jgi:hypothetical protein
MTKEAMTLLLEFAASSTGLIQTWDHSFFPEPVNIGEMPTILPCHFLDKNKKTLIRKPRNLEFDDQGENNGQV